MGKSFKIKFRNFIKKLNCVFSCCNSNCKISKKAILIDIDDLKIQISSLNTELQIVKKNSININTQITHI